MLFHLIDAFPRKIPASDAQNFVVADPFSPALKALPRAARFFLLSESGSFYDERGCWLAGENAKSTKEPFQRARGTRDAQICTLDA